MKEARLILPLCDNEGAPLRELHARLRENLSKRFYGVTETQGHGCWIGDGRSYDEAVVIYEVAAPGGAADNRYLRELAQFLAVEGKQKSIYVRYPNGEVGFVRAPATWLGS